MLWIAAGMFLSNPLFTSAAQTTPTIQGCLHVLALRSSPYRPKAVFDEQRPGSESRSLQSTRSRSGPLGNVDKFPNASLLILHQPVGQIAARYHGEHLTVFYNRQVPEPSIGDYRHRLADRRRRRDTVGILGHDLRDFRVERITAGGQHLVHRIPLREDAY